MHVAIAGCVHGELDMIYEKIKKKDDEDNTKTVVVLCCGDFQAIRNAADLEDLCCPPKYKHYGDFKDYYEGKKEAPILTIFVGGNHEAPMFLKELYYGGWVAKNIYYMGHSGLVNINGLRIAGLSGIYDARDFKRGYFETAPLNEFTKRSSYHIREFDVEKLMMVENPVDIVISHDWPRGIERFGNVNELIHKRKHLAPDINAKKLGSPHAWDLLKKLKPRYWFAAHHHIRFEANVEHDEGNTYFLALDKPIRPDYFMEFIFVPPSKSQKRKQDEEANLCYDVEWLSIVATNARLMPLNSFPSSVDLLLKKPNKNMNQSVIDGLLKAGCEPCTIDGSTGYKIVFPGHDYIIEPSKQRSMLMNMLNISDNAYFSPKSASKSK
uniref:Lariat-debranching enzyme, putative n=1 Tax=Babesia bovis TaxID=5865 RepID=S6C8X5_BABBO|nr:lariat-debranching enzyme, putative [Babesia bovis]